AGSCTSDGAAKQAWPPCPSRRGPPYYHTPARTTRRNDVGRAANDGTGTHDPGFRADRYRSRARIPAPHTTSPPVAEYKPRHRIVLSALQGMGGHGDDRRPVGGRALLPLAPPD